MKNHGNNEQQILIRVENKKQARHKGADKR